MQTGKPSKPSKSLGDIPTVQWLDVMQMISGFDTSLCRMNKRLQGIAKTYSQKLFATFIANEITDTPECLVLEEWPVAIPKMLEEIERNKFEPSPTLRDESLVSAGEIKDEKDPPCETSVDQKETKDQATSFQKLAVKNIDIQLGAKLRQRLWKPRQFILNWIEARKSDKQESKITDEELTKLAQAFFVIAKANAEKLFITLFSQLPISDEQRKKLLAEYDRTSSAADLLSAEQLNSFPELLENCPDFPKFLHIAAFLGNLPLTKFLLRQGVNPSVLDGMKKSALWVAANLGQTEIVKILLAEGSPQKGMNHFAFSVIGAGDPCPLIDFPYQSSEGPLSPLAAAIDKGHVEVVSHLLGLNAKMFHRFTFSQSLRKAFEITIANTKKNKLKIVKLILTYKEAEEFIRFPVPAGVINPFLLAAESGSLELVKFFVDNGADVHTLNNDGKSPLHLAAGGMCAYTHFYKEQVEILRWILGSKENPRFDVEAKDSAQYTALHHALLNGKYAAAIMLMKEYNANPCGVVTVANRQLDILSLAIRSGPSEGLPFLNFLDFFLPALKNHRDFNFQASLDIALWEVVMPPNLRPRDRMYNGAHVTAQKVIGKLLEAKANPKTSRANSTPFETAIMRGGDYSLTVAAGFLEQMQFLVKQQASEYLLTICRSLEEHTLEDPAAIEAAASIIKMLLAQGADMLYGKDRCSLDYIAAASNTNFLMLFVPFLQSEKQYSKIKDIVLHLSRHEHKFDANLKVFIDVLRAVPVLGKKFISEILAKVEVVPHYYSERVLVLNKSIKNLQNVFKSLKTLKEKQIPRLIENELKHLETKVKFESKGSVPAETKANAAESEFVNRFNVLWQCVPKDQNAQAEKNVIFALLVKYLLLGDFDPKTSIDAFDIIEMGIEQSSRWFGFSSAEYVKPLKALVMTPDDKPYFPIKWRAQIIKDLRNQLDEFLASLSKSEIIELNSLLSRICSIKIPEPSPLQTLSAPVPSLAAHLLQGPVPVSTPYTNVSDSSNSQSGPKLSLS